MYSVLLARCTYTRRIQSVYRAQMFKNPTNAQRVASAQNKWSAHVLRIQRAQPANGSGHVTVCNSLLPIISLTQYLLAQLLSLLRKVLGESSAVHVISDSFLIIRLILSGLFSQKINQFLSKTKQSQQIYSSSLLCRCFFFL